MDRTPSPTEIRALRGERSREEFAALVGVTPLTVYRWELPPGSPELRRPRGKVLERLLLRTGAPQPKAPAEPPTPPLADDADLAELLPALRAIDQCQLDKAEAELVSLLSGGHLHRDAARALASISLAKLQILLRHDTRAAFSTLLGVGDPARLPRQVQLQFHIVAALLHAHSDVQLFNAGKTNHHVALAESLLGDGDGDDRFLLWMAQLLAAAGTWDGAIVARLMERAQRMCALATTPLNRCLTREAMALAGLSFTRLAESARQADEFLRVSATGALPLQQLRALIWRAEMYLEEAAEPSQILQMLEQAEGIHRRNRIADGVHTMLLYRNKGEVLARLARLDEAESALVEAARVGAGIGYTPFRIYTALARLYLQQGRHGDNRALAEQLLQSEGVHREPSHAFARIALQLCDVLAGEAPADWFGRVADELAELRRVSGWPIAYRWVALHALAVTSFAGTLEQAERMLQLGERAIEWSPSPTASALYRRYRGNWLIRAGRLGEARQSLEAALATFEVSGNVPEALFVRRTLANLDAIEERLGADETLRETAEQLAAIGLVPPPLLHAETVTTGVATLPQSNPIESLLVPLQRLATRGLGASILQKELVNIVGELLPGRAIRLDEIDSNGGSTTLLARGGNVDLCFDLSDGVGRRLRVGVGGDLDAAQRAMLSALVAFASLAFEVSALRGFTTQRPERSDSEADASLPGFIAASEAMRRLKADLKRLSGSRSTIIITGESGTGKEVVARAIHDLSRRAACAYVTFNSAAVPRDLFEGQLFGYRKGAFTGASSDHPGVIRAADGGTLFLDEIGELPLDIQPKLLRFLENGEVFPLGERKPVRVDVRVIAATHRDLLQLVREGRFREDLYYRLQVIPVHLPPLRERREDVVALARHFVARLTPDGTDAPAIGRDGEVALMAHAWPGNVRELRNVIERALAFDPLPQVLTSQHLRF